MKVCCVFTALLGFSLCAAIQSMSNMACDSEPERVCVQVGGNVSVPCLYLPNKDVDFFFYKGKEEIAVYRANNASSSPESGEHVKHITEHVEFHTSEKDQLFSFVLSVVTAEDTGLYRCKMNVIFPPPLFVADNSSRILVLVEGHQCINKATCGSLVQDRNDTDHIPVWIWALVAFLGTYGITVTIIAIVNRHKLRRAEYSQSDYMNTKPTVHKGHGRTRGLQHPIPRHF
ncbi:T-cell-specific surface glycoprotein CD28 [Lampris incognitus]|uniref:T-cell-specific surface glycoprotein CD28 n=1 Tax=Lampris incognitus TaxID=2546036 RepID=UPI0024B513FC|nr:T-cell-specific surface glycoprotein CD28 [Lampris incognitus]